MNYSVVFSSNAIKDLHPIPRNYQQKIINRSESLGNNPFPVDSLKFKGLRENLYRIRAGAYRILYQVDTDVKIIDIRRISHRINIYKNWLRNYFSQFVLNPISITPLFEGSFFTTILKKGMEIHACIDEFSIFAKMSILWQLSFMI